jgi:hypothetical protein
MTSPEVNTKTTRENRPRARKSPAHFRIRIFFITLFKTYLKFWWLGVLFFDVVQKVTHRPIPAQRLSSLGAGHSPEPVSGNGEGLLSDQCSKFGPAKKLMAFRWTTSKNKTPNHYKN